MADSIEKYQFIFRWKIENFSFCKRGEGKKLYSAKFYAECLGNSKWYLALYPYEWLHPDGFVSGLLVREGGTGSVRIDYKLEISVQKSRVLVSECFFNEEFERDGIKGFGSFIPLDKIPDFGMNSEDSLVFRCFVSKNGSTVSLPTERTFLTKTNVNRHSFEWFVRRLQCHFEPKILEVTETSRLKISLTEMRNNLKIEISSISRKEFKVFYLECKMFAVDIEGEKRISRRATHLFSSNSTWTLPFLISKQYLKEVKLTTFTLLFEFTVPVEPIEEVMCLQEQTGSLFEDTLSVIEEVKVDSSSKTSEMLNPSAPSNSCTLQVEFRRMYLDRIKSDVVIRVGNESYPAHKCVLSTRSPVFNAMFEQDMLERQSGTVDITDFDKKVVNSFLLFLYTETVENMDYDTAVQLLMISDKYQVSSLKDMCSEFLESVINLENVCRILELADNIGNESLKKSSKRFIKKNAAKVFLSPDWVQCIKNNAKVVSEILHILSVEMGARLSSVQ